MKINFVRRQAYVYGGLSIFCLFLLLFVMQGCSTKTASSSPSSKNRELGSALPVEASKVIKKDVPINLQVVGNVEAYLTVTVKAQVSGELTQVFFHEGDFVKKRDELFKIDPRIYEAQLNQSEANLEKDRASLAQIEANLARDEAQEKYARVEEARYSNLFERNLISKEQLEQIRSNADALSAAVRADRAAIQSAKASVEAGEATVANAKVMLSYTTILSPLDGRTGNLDVKQGNVISPNTALTTINQIEPIYVTFAVPEAQLPLVKKSQVVTATAQGNISAPEVGELTFIDNTVDSTTGTIRLKGTFRNPDHKLWPGEFVRVTLRLGTVSDALIVPNQAVQIGQEGPFVFVVKPDQTVESRPVVTGARVDQDVVIEKGLQAGEVVVTEGQLRLSPGTAVKISGTSGLGSKESPAVSEVRYGK